jgi:hypothetical protein
MARFLARCAAVVALIFAVTVSLEAPAGASRDAAEAPVCRSDNGSDVARYFDLHGTDPIWLNLQGRQPPCLTVAAGRSLSRTHGWITQLPSRAVYPAGYAPTRRAPMADFLSKLTQARYVIRQGDEIEITRTVRRPALLERAKLGQFGDLFVAPDTTLLPGVTIAAEASEWTSLERFDTRTLAPGEHTIDIYWTLTEPHCDGFAPDPATDCLPAGESLTTSTPFTLTPTTDSQH